MPSSAWRRPKATCSGVYLDFFIGTILLFRKFRSSRKTRIYRGSEYGEQIKEMGQDQLPRILTLTLNRFVGGRSQSTWKGDIDANHD